MQDFEGKVAVVTGAASGIGLGLAERFAAEGMKVVLADVEAAALDAAVARLRQQERDVIGVLADVSRIEAIEELRDRTLEAYGGVHILCNNAGVGGGGGAAWESTPNDWTWALGVNLMGVIWGIRTFVPLMLEQDEPGWVVNTASVLGLQSGRGSPYGVSKHAVVRLSEGLYYDLKDREAKVGCSVLCPGMIATNITLSERNRPDAFRNEVDETARRQREEMRNASHQRFQEFGMPPSEVAEIVLDAIRAERFYILTHPENVKERLRARMEDILAERNPSPLPEPAEGAWARARPEAEARRQ
jgi:NAD(P)-dependent dehydrogenase (short-subunit alcohol dehydrogenase family)